MTALSLELLFRKRFAGVMRSALIEFRFPSATDIGKMDYKIAKGLHIHNFEIS